MSIRDLGQYKTVNTYINTHTHTHVLEHEAVESVVKVPPHV